MTRNVRVELDPPTIHSSMSYKEKMNEKDKAFRAMLTTFKRRVDEMGIKPMIKQKQFFESRSERARRKRRQAELERKKTKLREYFG